ncbi:hypothetical protein GGI26_004098 [Coemansia sp. RSA 1358]|nr:hypothetical protein GGI26_004098 [Coemansia sp. RSA 1358]
MRVVLADIQQKGKGDAYANELNNGYKEPVAVYIKTDLSRKEDISLMFEQADRVFSQIDILINNAAIASPHTLYESESYDNISSMLSVNLLAPIETMRLFAEYINNHKDKPKGVVVNVASMGGLVPNRGGEVYGAAKAAIIHLTKASKFLMPQIRVSAIAPYYVKSPMVLNNPKLQNNKTVYPQLMLSIDQVCRTIERCIEDERGAGKVFATIGSWGYAHIRQFELVWIQVALLSMWALFTASIRSVFSRSD